MLAKAQVGKFEDTKYLTFFCELSSDTLRIPNKGLSVNNES